MAKTTKTVTKTTKTTPAPSAKASTAGVATATKPAATKPAVPKTIATSKPAAASTCCGGSTSCASPSYEQIAQRAFEIWVAKGRPQGQDIENWKQAEADLMKGKQLAAV